MARRQLTVLALMIVGVGGVLPAGAQTCRERAPGGNWQTVTCERLEFTEDHRDTLSNYTCAAAFHETRFDSSVHPRQAALSRVTLTGSHTRCNDGSPAVWYVRSSPAPPGDPDAQKWLIVFESGGSAFDRNGTLDSGTQNRWTSGQGTDCLNKMSTDMRDDSTAPPSLGHDGAVDSQQFQRIAVGGILNPTPPGDTNPFANWNWAYLNYCSSDHWTGAKGVLTADEYVDLFDVAYTDQNDVEREGARVYFHGRNILWAVLNDLNDGVVRPDGGGAEGGQISVAPLETSTTIVLAADSAGSGAVQHNLDDVALRYSQADVAGILGAGHSPSVGTSADTWWIDDPNDGNTTSDVEEGAVVQFGQVGRISGVLDFDCTYIEGTYHGTAWKCLLLSETNPYLSTRHLIRQDFLDDLKVPDVWQASPFRDGLEHDYDAWVGSTTTSFFAPSYTTHATLLQSEFYTQELVACEDSGLILGGPEIARTSFRDAAERIAEPLGAHYAYDQMTVSCGGLPGGISINCEWKMPDPVTGTCP